MGFGRGGFGRRGETELSNLAKQGVETSQQNGTDTDIIIFNMSSSVAVGDLESAGSHQVTTSVQVDTP